MRRRSPPAKSWRSRCCPATDPTRCAGVWPSPPRRDACWMLRPDAGVRGARDVRPACGGGAARDDALARRAARRPGDHACLGLRRPADSRGWRATFRCSRRWRSTCRCARGWRGASSESISEDGDVLDSASPRLRRLRAEHTRAPSNACKNGSARWSTSSARRCRSRSSPCASDRYVLPVRAEAREPGARHRPRPVGQRRDGLRRAAGDRRDEQPAAPAPTRRAARRSSASCRSFRRWWRSDAPYMTLAVELLAEIDLQLAKARYAGLMRASAPQHHHGWTAAAAPGAASAADWPRRADRLSGWATDVQHGGDHRPEHRRQDGGAEDRGPALR